MGEKIVASCFFSHYFVNYGKKETLPLTAKDNISFIQKIPQDFEDFSIILSIRNPYFQIISHYLDISHTNWNCSSVNFGSKVSWCFGSVEDSSPDDPFSNLHFSVGLGFQSRPPFHTLA